MEVMIKKKNIALDSQILSTLMGCARLTDFRFNHHLTSIWGKPKSFEMGSIVHVFLEHYYGAIIKGVTRNNAIAIGLEKAQEYSQNPDEVKNTELEDRQWALQTCEIYADHYKNDPWIPLEVETVKGKLIYEDDEIRILWKAKFDLIADTAYGIYPVDHKTMSQNRDTLTLNNQFIGQCALLDTQTMQVNKVGFQKTLKPNEKFQRVVMNYSIERIMEWTNEIVPFYSKLWIAYLESGYFPPNFSHCETKYGFCQFKSVCEANPNMREDELRNNFIVGKVWDIANTKEGE